LNHGLTGTRHDRPGPREVPAACREGDTLVVAKLDRLARSPPDARDIVDELTYRHVKLSLGDSMPDPNHPVGRLVSNVLAMVAEFEADLIRTRTHEGMRVAQAKGRVRGKQPKLNPRQEAHLAALHRAGEHSSAELCDRFGVARSTVYHAIQRDQRRPQPLSSEALDRQATLRQRIVLRPPGAPRDASVHVRPRARGQARTGC
jgi:DNA invertase Pin-like site-specific DNA recombinase